MRQRLLMFYFQLTTLDIIVPNVPSWAQVITASWNLRVTRAIMIMRWADQRPKLNLTWKILLDWEKDKKKCGKLTNLPGATTSGPWYNNNAWRSHWRKCNAWTIGVAISVQNDASVRRLTIKRSIRRPIDAQAETAETFRLKRRSEGTCITESPTWWLRQWICWFFWPRLPVRRMTSVGCPF